MMGTPLNLRSYQTFMDLTLDYGKRGISEYRRELDLVNGVSTVSYKANGSPFVQESFVSLASDILVVRLESKEPFELSINLSRERNASVEAVSNNELILTGRIIDERTDKITGPEGAHMKFAGRLMAIPDQGDIVNNENGLIVKDVIGLTLLLNVATNYDFDRTDINPGINEIKLSGSGLEEAGKQSYSKLKEGHMAAFSKIMDRTTFQLGTPDHRSVPTNKRLRLFYEGNTDLDLITTYFQFGRYLLLSSSNGTGVLPANLQGIWNKDIKAPWNSDYHTNINLQMNYWPADVANLPETVAPLTNFMKEIAKSGAQTSRKMFNADGWVVNHCTDAFAHTAVHDGPWGIFPLAGAWMTLPLWRHYEFTMDGHYLANEAWPIMKGAVEFALDFLVEDSQGKLVTVPSQSPENAYLDPETGEAYHLTIGSAMDIQIVRELFHNSLKAIDVLGELDNKVLRGRIEQALAKLLPTSIGKDGTIMEWFEDYEDRDVHHRHVSHLFALYPGTQISAHKTPGLFDAARKTLEKRGDAGTGWSLAWKIAFWARLQNGNRAETLLKKLLRPVTGDEINHYGGGSYSNLLCAHPPFQIDGNLGGTASIAEMLIQSHDKGMDILPALPDTWSSGQINGLMARGGFEVDIHWEENTLRSLVIKSRMDNEVQVRYEGKTRLVKAKPDEVVVLDGNLNVSTR